MIEILCHDGAAEVLCPPEQAGGFEQAAGTGTIHCYSLIDGVRAMLLRLEMQSYTEVRTQPGLLELNFCVDGRFETRFSLRDQVLLSRVPRQDGAAAYCSAKQMELVRHLRDHLLTDREGDVSLAQLAAEHEISVSHLQKLFNDNLA